jgi:hypothetical protein
MFDISMLTVLKETLESRGVLGQIKARIRAEVFNALDDQASFYWAEGSEVIEYRPYNFKNR